MTRDYAAHSPGRAENARIRSRRDGTPGDVPSQQYRDEHYAQASPGVRYRRHSDAADSGLWRRGTAVPPCLALVPMARHGVPGAASTCGSSGSEITGNHGHLLTANGRPHVDHCPDLQHHGQRHARPLADLVSGRSYQLNSGGTVTEVSSVTDAPTFGSHLHGVTVTCGRLPRGHEVELRKVAPLRGTLRGLGTAPRASGRGAAEWHQTRISTSYRVAAIGDSDTSPGLAIRIRLRRWGWKPDQVQASAADCQRRPIGRTPNLRRMCRLQG